MRPVQAAAVLLDAPRHLLLAVLDLGQFAAGLQDTPQHLFHFHCSGGPTEETFFSIPMPFNSRRLDLAGVGRVLSTIKTSSGQLRYRHSGHVENAQNDGFLSVLLGFGVHTGLSLPDASTCNRSWKRIGVKC